MRGTDPRATRREDPSKARSQTVRKSAREALQRVRLQPLEHLET